MKVKDVVKFVVQAQLKQMPKDVGRVYEQRKERYKIWRYGFCTLHKSSTKRC